MSQGREGIDIFYFVEIASSEVFEFHVDNSLTILKPLSITEKL